MQGEAESLVRRSVIGATIDEEFPGGRLPQAHPFSWASFQEAPKELRQDVVVRGSWYRDMRYNVLHTGGFVRLCTDRGRVYFNAQNETGHTTPDWKFHASVHLDDLGPAWDILAALFIEMKAEIGMKAVVVEEGGWSEGQRGRELTMYAFVYSPSYQDYLRDLFDLDDERYCELFLHRAHQAAYSTPFYFTLVREAERRLAAADIRPRGVADGDLALPGCTYISLRNEAFVDGVYPPNDRGWNAANHQNPFLELIFFLLHC